MSEQWTDERIAKEAALARVGSYSRTPVGWERMIEELLTQIRNDMQSQIGALRQQLAEAQAEIAELRQRLAASRKANAEVKALRGILGAALGALDFEIDDMIYDWMEAENSVRGDIDLCFSETGVRVSSVNCKWLRLEIAWPE